MGHRRLQPSQQEEVKEAHSRRVLEPPERRHRVVEAKFFDHTCVLGRHQRARIEEDRARGRHATFVAPPAPRVRSCCISTESLQGQGPAFNFCQKFWHLLSLSVAGWRTMRGWLRQSIRDMRSVPPSWRELAAGAQWFQLRGDKLYQHMVPGPLEDAVIVFTVLGVGQVEAGVEINDEIRSFVVDVIVEGEPAALASRSSSKKRRGKRRKGAGAVSAAEEPETKIFYASNLGEAQMWNAAIADAADENRIVPGEQDELRKWLQDIAAQLREQGSRAAAQAREMLCCNATGLARVVDQARPPGGNSLHIACRFLGDQAALLAALCEASSESMLAKNDAGAVPLHLLLTYFPECTASAVQMYQLMAAANGGKGPVPAADKHASTPLHTLARFFKHDATIISGSKRGSQLPAALEDAPDGSLAIQEDATRHGRIDVLARACIDTMIGLIDVRPDALNEADDKGRLPLHVFARYHGDLLAPLRLLVWRRPASAAAASKNGYLPLHYVARYHGASAASIALLRGIGGDETLLARSMQDWLPVHLLCRHGTTPEAVKALITPETAMSRVPGGLTPLHLLCKFHPAHHAVVAACIQANPAAARAPCDDGGLPLHLLAAEGVQGADASLSLLLDAYSEGCCERNFRGLIPLQVLPASSKLMWASRSLLETVTLRVQERREALLKRDVEKDVLHSLARDGHHPGGPSSGQASAAERLRGTSGVNRAEKGLVDAEEGSGSRTAALQSATAAEKEEYRAWWRANKRTGPRGLRVQGEEAREGRFEIVTTAGSYIVEVKDRKKTSVFGRGKEERGGGGGSRDRGGGEQASAELTTGRRGAKMAATPEARARGKGDVKTREEVAETVVMENKKRGETSKEKRQRLKSEALAALTKLYGEGREADPSREGLSQKERAIARYMQGHANDGKPEGALAVNGRTLAQVRAALQAPEAGHASEANISRRLWDPAKEEAKALARAAGRKRRELQARLGRRMRTTGVQVIDDALREWEDGRGAGDGQVWVADSGGVWVPDVVKNQVEDQLWVPREIQEKVRNDGVAVGGDREGEPLEYRLAQLRFARAAGGHRGAGRGDETWVEDMSDGDAARRCVLAVSHDTKAQASQDAAVGATTEADEIGAFSARNLSHEAVDAVVSAAVESRDGGWVGEHREGLMAVGEGLVEMRPGAGGVLRRRRRTMERKVAADRRDAGPSGDAWEEGCDRPGFHVQEGGPAGHRLDCPSPECPLPQNVRQRQQLPGETQSVRGGAEGELEQAEAVRELACSRRAQEAEVRLAQRLVEVEETARKAFQYEAQERERQRQNQTEAKILIDATQRVRTALRQVLNVRESSKGSDELPVDRATEECAVSGDTPMRLLGEVEEVEALAELVAVQSKAAASKLAVQRLQEIMVRQKLTTSAQLTSQQKAHEGVELVSPQSKGVDIAGLGRGDAGGWEETLAEALLGSFDTWWAEPDGWSEVDDVLEAQEVEVPELTDFADSVLLPIQARES